MENVSDVANSLRKQIDSLNKHCILMQDGLETEIERLKREVKVLETERDEWKTLAQHKPEYEEGCNCKDCRPKWPRE